jgi:hypothetical protein
MTLKEISLSFCSMQLVVTGCDLGAKTNGNHDEHDRG